MPAPPDVVVETGTGENPAANSYVSVDDCDAYHNKRLWADDWNGADADTKKRGVLFATMVLDQSVDWNGFLSNENQPLKWPRARVENRERFGYVYGQGSTSPFWDSTKIPRPIKDATCELARLLIGSDRTAEDKSKGITSFSIGGELSFTFDKKDRKKVFSEQLQQMLRPFGTFRFRRGQVRVVRT